MRNTVTSWASLLIVACTVPVAAATLHPGDKISISVFNHPELLTQASLDSSGRVSVPIVGPMDAANMDTAQLAQRIAKRLAEYVKKPGVDVQLVSQGLSIFVAGGPGGVLPYQPGETLIGALDELRNGSNNAAGGNNIAPTPEQISSRDLGYGRVDLHHVVLSRDGRDSAPIDVTVLHLKGGTGPALQPGDTIKLADKPISVPVSGEVKQPGVAHLANDEPLSNALLQVGSANDLTASVNFILKRDGQKKLISASSAEYSAPARPGDEVYVPHGVRIGVVGTVNKPGEVLLRGDSSLLSAIYYAGGPLKYSDIKHVQVLHQGQSVAYDVTKLSHGAPAENPTLQDGDTVFVPEGHKLQIDAGTVFQGIFALARFFPVL